jgi:hypothetical protein
LFEPSKETMSRISLTGLSSSGNRNAKAQMLLVKRH